MTLSLLSSSPDFHGLAMAFIADHPESSLAAEVLKPRMGGVGVGDPHDSDHLYDLNPHEQLVDEYPAIESGLVLLSSEAVDAVEADINTTTLPVIDMKARVSEQV